ncbi:MAG: ABC transporter ATP-binding protein [bacterium]
MENNSILEATDLYRAFKTSDTTVNVLSGISISVPKGEMLAVTGASGVGKSTLLHLLGGLDKPTKGEIRIDNELLNNKSEEELSLFRNRNVGFVFQSHYLLEDFNALENVMIPLLIGGKNRTEAAKKGELLLDLVGLTDRKTHRPTQLSGGEQQRVAVARALANDPQIVLADEPSGNLDTDTGRKLHDLLFKLNRDFNTTFLIATHNKELAQGCNRQLKIIGGKLSE